MGQKSVLSFLLILVGNRDMNNDGCGFEQSSLMLAKGYAINGKFYVCL